MIVSQHPVSNELTISGLHLQRDIPIPLSTSMGGNVGIFLDGTFPGRQNDSRTTNGSHGTSLYDGIRVLIKLLFAACWAIICQFWRTILSKNLATFPVNIGGND